MSPTLWRYLVSLYLKVVLLTAGAMGLVFLVVDFGDRFKLFSGHPAVEVAQLYACKLAVTLGQLLPAAMLLAGGVALTLLQRDGELDAMRSAGISPVRVTLSMLGAALGLSVAAMAFDEHVAGPAGFKVDQMMRASFGVWGDSRHYFGNQQWVRLGARLVRISEAKGDVLLGITVFNMGSRFTLDQRVDAAALKPNPQGGFALEGATVRDFRKEPHLLHLASDERVLADAAPNSFALRPGRPEQMSSRQLLEQHEVRTRAGLPTVRTLLALHGRYSYPLLGVVGLALTAALGLRRGRKPALTVAIVEGLLVSAVLWGLWVIFRALALAERLPAATATWGAVACLGAVAMVLLRRVEKSS